jgi:hypothetical protein
MDNFLQEGNGKSQEFLTKVGKWLPKKVTSLPKIREAHEITLKTPSS